MQQCDIQTGEQTGVGLLVQQLAQRSMQQLPVELSAVSRSVAHN
jgi:hypothetical protein